MTFIDVTGLKRHFMMGDTLVRALDGVDLSVEEGEFLCLMGPSGSGKSTLLNMLGGLDTPDEGTVIVDGQEISALDANGLAVYRQKKVGFIFQSFNLITSMTAIQNVEFPMIFSGVAPDQRRARAARLLTALGLGDRMDHKPTELSGGQQQRVAIARGLVNQPVIMFCDEPTGNLDSKTGMEILDMLAGLNQNGQTLVVVTHDPRVADYATRTVQMLDGLIVSDNGNGHKQ
ncbi:MAG: ABC transporter ATP-binding protein [Anaerolineae bacterium]|nr:ABC transporter ATP-binding protein [Anaerolineae bacterium]